MTMNPVYDKLQLRGTDAAKVGDKADLIITKMVSKELYSPVINVIIYEVNQFIQNRVFGYYE